MKLALILLALPFSAFAFEASNDVLCDGREMVPGGDGRMGEFRISVTVKGDLNKNETSFTARWATDRGFISGPGMACGKAIPAGMQCVTSMSQVNGGKETYLRQSCGEPFRHFGGPYYPFDSGFSFNNEEKEGQFTCVIHTENDSHVEKFLSVRLTNCR